MATLERIYNVPLRKAFYKVPKYKKTKKAVLTLKQFIAKHMKCSVDEVRLGKHVNEALWTRGYKYPPHHVKITAIKSDDGKVRAELFGFKYDEPVKADEKQDKATKNKEETEKEIADIKNEVDKIVDVDKVEEPAEKLVKKEKKSRAKKTAEPKEEQAESAETEEKPKKERKPRAKKAAEEKAE
jgi:ribosomal protein L31E